jgi:proteasome lid subunit RPN8/RPN11
MEVENIDPNPETGYFMRTDTVIPLIENDMVAATWHTHPDSDPALSGEDYIGFLNWPDFRHYIIGIRDGKPAVVCHYIEDGLVLICDSSSTDS